MWKRVISDDLDYIPVRSQRWFRGQISEKARLEWVHLCVTVVPSKQSGKAGIDKIGYLSPHVKTINTTLLKLLIRQKRKIFPQGPFSSCSDQIKAPEQLPNEPWDEIVLSAAVSRLTNKNKYNFSLISGGMQILRVLPYWPLKHPDLVEPTLWQSCPRWVHAPLGALRFWQRECICVCVRERKREESKHLFLLWFWCTASLTARSTNTLAFEPDLEVA